MVEDIPAVVLPLDLPGGDCCVSVENATHNTMSAGRHPSGPLPYKLTNCHELVRRLIVAHAIGSEAPEACPL